MFFFSFKKQCQLGRQSAHTRWMRESLRLLGYNDCNVINHEPKINNHERSFTLRPRRTPFFSLPGWKWKRWIFETGRFERARRHTSISSVLASAAAREKQPTYITDKTRLGVPFCLQRAQWQNARTRSAVHLVYKMGKTQRDCFCRRRRSHRERGKNSFSCTHTNTTAQLRKLRGEAAEIEWPFKSRSSKSAAAAHRHLCVFQQTGKLYSNPLC